VTRLVGWYAALATLAGFGFLVFSQYGANIVGIGAIVLCEGALSFMVPHLAVWFLGATRWSGASSRTLSAVADTCGLSSLTFYVFPSPTVAAMAFGYGKHRAIILSSRVAEDFPGPEVGAIVAHEIGHFHHRDLYLYTALAMLITIVLPLLGMAVSVTVLVQAFTAIVVLPLLLIPLLLAVSRARERAADRFGALTYGDTRAYVHALERSERIANDRRATQEPRRSVLATVLSSHPSFSERIRYVTTLESSTNG
jgi:STE24 endopeptidase